MDGPKSKSQGKLKRFFISIRAQIVDFFFILPLMVSQIFKSMSNKKDLRFFQNLGLEIRENI